MCQIDMPKLADDARFNRFHAKVLLWCLLILIIDGYDIAVMGIALPSIMQQMGVNASTAGFMASSALFGMMFGAMVLGTLSDRIGRRWALSIGVMLFSVFTAPPDSPRTRSASAWCASSRAWGLAVCCRSSWHRWSSTRPRRSAA